MLMFPNACVGGPLLKDGGPPTGGPRLGPPDGGGPRPGAPNGAGFDDGGGGPRPNPLSVAGVAKGSWAWWLTIVSHRWTSGTVTVTTRRPRD